MSLSSAKEFIEKVKADQAFRENFESTEDKDARLKLLEKEGFYFTEAECRQAIAEDEGELSDDQLDNVSGGAGGPQGQAAFKSFGKKQPCGW